MTSAKPIVFLACKVFEGMVCGAEPVNNIYLDYGLHSLPKQLRRTLQERIDAMPQPSVIVLGYGLCGNGLNQIQAGHHTLIVPKADDCVAMFMGSRARYLEQFHSNPGTYYLTKGWLEVGSDPLSEYESLTKKYGEETASWVMEQQFQHYKKLILVAQNDADLDAYRHRALEVAAYCERFGMVYEEYLGATDFVDQIAAVLDEQQRPGSEFIVVPPGGTLTQEMFLK